MEQVIVKTTPRKKVLSQEEKLFFDYILEGYGNTDAIFKSGIMPMDQAKDKAMRKKASRKAKALLDTKSGRQYLRDNRKTVVAYVPSDIDTIATHMMEIAMGRAKMKKSFFSEEQGEMVEYDVMPEFKDQIAASNWLLKFNEYKKNDVKNGSGLKLDKSAENIALGFISKFNNTRQIDDGVFENVNGKEKYARRAMEVENG